MNSDYLGEENLAVEDSEYKLYTKEQWASLWIEMYGQIDGDHHKAWCLDQVQRILLGTKVLISVASWENGYQEVRFKLAEPSKEYLDYVEKWEDGGEYSWDTGIAP